MPKSLPKQEILLYGIQNLECFGHFVEFLKYKQQTALNRTGTTQLEVSGLLWLHLLSGRGLRSSSSQQVSTANLG